MGKLRSALDEAIKTINKKFKIDIVGDKSVGRFATKDFIEFPTPSLSYLFHGEMPTATLWLIVGRYSSGKSSLCYGIMANAQKKFGDSKKCLLLDTEQSSDIDYMDKCGVDTDNIIYIRPQMQSAEELLQIVLDLIDTGEIGFVLIDSLATLVSQTTLDNELLKKSYAGIAATLTTFLNKLMPRLNKYGVTVVCINQLRDSIGSMIPGQVSIPGGQALKFNSHVILQLRKERSLDEKLVECSTSSAETIFGQTSSVAVLKNKISEFTRRLTKITVTPDMGVNYYNDLFMLAVSMGILEQKGSWYQYGEQKWQGKPNVLNAFKEDSELFNEILSKVKKECFQ